MNINQKESPEAYREYMREYQKIYRKRHKHYYRDLKRKKKEAEDMSSKLTEIQNAWNEIVTSAIANEYNKFEKQTDILPLVEKLHEMLIKYASEVSDASKS